MVRNIVARKLGRLLPVLAGVLALAACAMPWQVAEVQDIETTAATGGTPFTQALLVEYRHQAHNEAYVEQDWLHAVMFARKGDRAARGKLVLPENPATWDIPAAALPALTEAHARLVADLDHGARDRVPALAAKAQANFDCWVEEEWESDSDQTCKTIVLAALPQLAPPQAPAPVAAARPPRVVKTFVVYFDYDKAGLDAAARKVLAEVAASQAVVKPLVISVAGFTDTMGGKSYNQNLSEHRAHAVAAALAGLGVAARLDPVGFGKTHLAVKTRNHVREARNRRVEIHFESPAPVTVPGVTTSAAPGSSSLLRSDGDRLSQAATAAPAGVVAVATGTGTAATPVRAAAADTAAAGLSAARPAVRAGPPPVS